MDISNTLYAGNNNLGAYAAEKQRSRLSRASISRSRSRSQHMPALITPAVPIALAASSRPPRLQQGMAFSIPRVAQNVTPADAAPTPILAPVAIKQEVIDVDFLDQQDAHKSACTAAVLDVFPDICPAFLAERSEQLHFDYGAVVGSIADDIEASKPYPKRPARKRKRQPSDVSDAPGSGGAGGVSDAGRLDKTPGKHAGVHFGADRFLVPVDGNLLENEAVRRYGGNRRVFERKHPEYEEMCKVLVQQAFPFVPSKEVTANLRLHGGCLLPAILYIDWKLNLPAGEGQIKLKKTATRRNLQYLPENLAQTIQQTSSIPKREALEEYCTAMAVCEARKEEVEKSKRKEREEVENMQRAQVEGTVKECECCFANFPMNRMVHCDGRLFHWFCKNCVRRMAESQVGLSKYELVCMSTDGCNASFTPDQQKFFLSEKTRMALERLEQEHILRIAGIENLETCPFCPFSAECPPVEVNKEFRCQNPSCMEVSCRLCHKATHIPKTCEENERENGPSARLAIEEAMSAALIRVCNKCRTPFIKENGCNKMKCTRPGCGNVQCYVCHKSCSYSHFDDASRGGKNGNCPLFDSVEERHDSEVKRAQEMALKDVTAKNPGIDINKLKITMSARVLQDEKRRILNAQGFY